MVANVLRANGNNMLEFIQTGFGVILLTIFCLIVWESCKMVDEKKQASHKNKCMGGEDE